MSLFQGILQIIIYAVTLGADIFIVAKNWSYFRGAFKRGMVQALVLSMLIFLVSYGVKMMVALWTRATDLTGNVDPTLAAMQSWAWTISTGMTMVSMLILAYLAWKNRYTAWIYLTSMEPTKPEMIEKMVEDVLNENEDEVQKIRKGE